jgi:hypothetical protein
VPEVLVLKCLAYVTSPLLLRCPQRKVVILARSGGHKACASRAETVRRLLLLIVLYTVPAVASLQPVIDPDIWWHLRTGQWIVEHGSVPTTDPFSVHGMGKPWVAYSWLFEVLVYGLHQAFGLVGLVLYTTALSWLVTVALHLLVRRFEPRFTHEIALTALGLCGLLTLLSPRPWLFTILFFIVELNILMAARQSGQARHLALLPLLFALWANVHIQFIYGLFLLGLAAVESVIDRYFRRLPVAGNAPTILCRQWLFILAACAVATLATPYHFSLYGTVFELIRQTGPFRYVSEFVALGFRSLADWFALAATLGAAFSLGRWRQTRPFPLLLLAAGAFLSFRASRDVWFVVVAAVVSIATCHATVGGVERFLLTWGRVLLVAGAVMAILVVVGRLHHISQEHLQAVLAEHYPVAAAAVIEERGYPGPLYNNFNWGGYLIWRLPRLPVAMDGRTNVHGDARIEQALRTWTGKRGWASDPELTAARLVLAGVDWPLASLLRLDSRFTLVYEDAIAVVFITQPD